MKKVLRKDLKAVLTPVSMMAIAFVVQECMILAGVGLRNASLIATCIYIALFAAAITLIYHLYIAGGVFLRNLRERQYFYTLRAEGVSKYKVLIYKFLYSVGSLIVFAVAYVAALYLDIQLFTRAFPEEKEGFSKLGVRKMICGENGDAFAPAFMATVFEYLTAGTLLLALVFAVVAVTYSVFHRTKLCGFNCVLVYLVMFGAFLKVYAATINGLSGTAAHVHAGVMQLILTVLFMAFALYMMKKIVPDEPTPDI